MSQLLPQSYDTASPETLLTRGLLFRRFCAFLIDGFSICVLGWIAAITIFLLGILTLGLGWLMFHIIPLLPFFYYTLWVGGFGATPGQKLLGLAVRQDVDLSRPNMAQALVWSLLLWVSFLLACLPLAIALVQPRHRAGHDLLSGLVVVRN